MDHYTIRINKAVDYIEENLSEVINLSDIATVSELSKYHFHKIFKSATGETVGEFIRRIRLEKSADMLIRTQNSMTIIAVETGFSSSSVFSREFKKKFAISPRDFRLLFRTSNNLTISKRIEFFKKFFSINKSISEIMRFSLPATNESLSFKIETLPEYSVFYMRYIGEYTDLDNIFSLWINLKKFAEENFLINPKSLFFSIMHDNPNICKIGKCRYDACMSVPEQKNINILKNKIGYRVISSGKYAVFNFKGDLPHLFKTMTNIDYFCFKNIGYEPDNKPPYFRHYSISEKKESFEFEICVPIRKI